MRKVIDVLRRASAQDAPWHQSIPFETDDDQATVATALRFFDGCADLRDVDGNPVEPIRWDSSCLQRRCGACAMVINGIPRLACDTRLTQLRGERVRLEPLRKFPVIADLLVDRATMLKTLTQAEVWLEDHAELGDRRWEIAYDASRCLQCGLCLEVCPNVYAGGPFGGMAAMAPLARLLAEAESNDRERIARRYRETVYGGCGKSLACRDVCPAQLDIDSLMSRSNAVAVWHRWGRS